MRMQIVNPGDFALFRSVERPWITCTPDRLIYDGDKLVSALELKCAWYESAKEWNKTIPLLHQIQGQQTMYVLGLDSIYFAALLNGCSFRWHTMRRNERWLAKMLPRLDAFWESIKRGEYPNVDASTATAEALARRYPNPGAGVIELADEMEQLGAEYDAILEQEKELDKRKLLIANMAKEAIGDNTVGVLPDQSGFRWALNGKGRRFTRVAKVNLDG